MTDANELIEEVLLQHAYDPVKAREYYLRTRQLKGRGAPKKAFSKSVAPSRPPDKLGRPFGHPDYGADPPAPRDQRLAALDQRLSRFRAALARQPERKRKILARRLAEAETRAAALRSAKTQVERRTG